MNSEELDRHLESLSIGEVITLYKDEKKAKEWLVGKLNEQQESLAWLSEKKLELLDAKRILDSQYASLAIAISELKSSHNELAQWTLLSRYGRSTIISKVISAIFLKIGGVGSGNARKKIRSLLEKQEDMFSRLEIELENINKPPGVDPKKQFSEDKKIELDDFLSSDDELSFVQDAPVISVILILYNRAELTFACLQSLQQHADVPFQLIVVDNASSDCTHELLDKISGATIIRNSENRHFLLACNQAATEVKGEYMLFLNNDAQIHEHALSNAMHTIESDSKIGAVGGKIILLDGTAQEAGNIVWRDGGCQGYGRGMDPMDPSLNFRRDVDYCSGAFLLTPTRLFNQFEGFDERYAPAYYEETDYCLTLWENDYRVVYEPTAVITHFEFASSSSSDKAIELQEKNRTIFAKKHKAFLSRKFPPNIKLVEQARHALTGIKKVLYIDDRIPHKFFGAGFPRSNEIVNIIAELGYAVTLVPLNFPGEDTLQTAYSDINPRIELCLSTGRDNIFDFLSAKEVDYDFVWISRPHNMQFFVEQEHALNAIFGEAKIIYDAEAIFTTRNMHKAALTGSPWSDKKYLAELENEVELTRDADVVTTVSSAESALIHRYVPDVPTYELTHIIDVDCTEHGYEDRSDILFIGNMDYDKSPNVDSVVWFARYVFPAIRNKHPEVKLHLVGSADSKLIKKLASNSIIVHGRVDNVDSFYDDARIFIAPTRYAAGVPAKVIEASAYGVPVVVTEILADQLDYVNGQELVAVSHENAALFAERTLELYDDSILWKSIRESGRKKAVELYSKRHHSELIANILDVNEAATALPVK